MKRRQSWLLQRKGGEIQRKQLSSLDCCGTPLAMSYKHYVNVGNLAARNQPIELRRQRTDSLGHAFRTRRHRVSPSRRPATFPRQRGAAARGCFISTTPYSSLAAAAPRWQGRIGCRRNQALSAPRREHVH